MKSLQKMFNRKIHKEEQGFTLIELLIVIAILGILASVIIPSASGFVLSGYIGAANAEVATFYTTVEGWEGDNVNSTKTTITNTDIVSYLPTGATLKAVYTYTIASGTITAVTDPASGATWPSGMYFSIGSQMWIKSSGAGATGRAVS